MSESCLLSLNLKAFFLKNLLSLRNENVTEILMGHFRRPFRRQTDRIWRRFTVFRILWSFSIPADVRCVSNIFPFIIYMTSSQTCLNATHGVILRWPQSYCTQECNCTHIMSLAYIISKVSCFCFFGLTKERLFWTLMQPNFTFILRNRCGVNKLLRLNTKKNKKRARYRD